MFLSSRRVRIHACWPKKVDAKFDLKPRSREIVVTQVGHVACHSMRLGKRNSLGPTHCSISILSKVIGKKTHLTSYDLERPEGEVMGSNLYMGHREWPDMRQSWDFQYDLPPTFEIKCIWTFSQCLITAWSENWPDLRSLKSKFRDSRFLGTDDLINSWKIPVNFLRTVATAQSQIF